MNHNREMMTSPVPAQTTTSPSQIDIIVSIATGYKDLGEYRQFVSTLRRTGANCPVLLGISDGPEYEPVKRYLLENAINYFIVPPISPRNKIQNGLRFVIYGQWLRDLNFRYALMLDFRDVYFQRDPFTDVDAFMRDCDLYLMSEFQLLTIGNHPNEMNYAWIEEPFGKTVADAIADKAILNCGAIMGSKRAVMKLLDAYTEVSTKQNFEFIDQGTLNYLTYTGRLNQCGRIKIERAGVSIVNNCGFSEIDLLRETHPISPEDEARIAFIPRDEYGKLRLYRDHDGWVLDDDGNISYVVHQFDRFRRDMEEFVTWLSDYTCPDHVFVNSGDRPYRGEKFTLSSRADLKPGAVQWLIRKIRSLPVGKKSLLVVNANFKRGFVFAYGILNVELMFEPEDYRGTFFEPTLNAQKCLEFCDKWGYQAVVVEESDIFLPSEIRRTPTQTARDFHEARVQADRWFTS